MDSCPSFLLLPHPSAEHPLERLMIPIKNPFSSILYVWRASMLYSVILWRRRLKYRLYLVSQSALCRLLSIPAVHCKMRWILCRLMKRVTQLSLMLFFATCDAKFWITRLVGGRPLLVSPIIYLTSSSSCCGLSFRWLTALTAHNV